MSHLSEKTDALSMLLPSYFFSPIITHALYASISMYTFQFLKYKLLFLTSAISKYYEV